MQVCYDALQGYAIEMQQVSCDQECKKQAYKNTSPLANAQNVSISAFRLHQDC